MSLRRAPVEERATLPDGRTAVVRIAVPDDSYIAKKELDTVALELEVDGVHAAAINTILRPDQSSEARRMAREIVAGLESGTLEPTAGALEPLADSIPS